MKMRLQRFIFVARCRREFLPGFRERAAWTDSWLESCRVGLGQDSGGQASKSGPVIQRNAMPIAEYLCLDLAVLAL